MAKFKKGQRVRVCPKLEDHEETNQILGITTEMEKMFGNESTISFVGIHIDEDIGEIDVVKVKGCDCKWCPSSILEL